MDRIQKNNTDPQAFWWIQTHIVNNGGTFKLENTSSGYTLHLHFSDPDLTGFTDKFARIERTKIGPNGINLNWAHRNVRIVEATIYKETERGQTLVEALEKHFANFVGRVKTFHEKEEHASARNFINDEAESGVTAERFTEDYEIKKTDRFIRLYVDDA